MHYRINQSGGKIDCLVIDIKDLNIEFPIQETDDKGETKIVNKHVEDVAPQMFEYSLERYTKLNKTSIVEGRLPINNVLTPVNKFIETLSIEDQRALAMTIFNMHVQICQKFSTNCKKSELDDFTYELGEFLITLDNEIHLIDKIARFVSEQVPLGNFQEIGTREQDTKELTFLEPDVHGLTVIAILNKILSPLFGVYMNILRNKKELNCDLGYELSCSFILSKILSKHYSELIEKFKNYIRHNIEKKNSFISSDSATMLHLTPNTMCIKMYAQLLIRSFVNVDLYNMERNLMSFVCRSILDATNSTAKNINEYRVFVRKPTVKHQDEDTSGYLDVNSSVSRVPFDTARITASAVYPTVKTCLATYAQIFSEEDFAQSMAYYRQNTIVPNAWNRYLANAFYRNFLGGSQSIQMLRSTHFSELIACLQMIALKQGYIELAHMLTARKSAGSCPENLQFSSKYRSGLYEKVREIFENGPIGPLPKSFDNYMSIMVQDLATHNWYFNSSMVIWEATDHEPLNGEQIPLKSVVEEGCGLILYAQDIENGVYDTDLRSLSQDFH